MSNKILKVGIAGYGIVGKRRRRCLESNEHVKVVAICDRDFKSTGVTEDGVLMCPHYSKILQLDLDILMICLTNDVASEVTIKGLKRGFHVFL